MKSLITLIALVITTSAFANINPEIVDINTESLDFVSSIMYDEDQENIAFFSDTNISVVQIYNNDGQLQFQLPVMSNEVKINKNLFGQGIFNLGFILEGSSDVKITQIVIK